MRLDNRNVIGTLLLLLPGCSAYAVTAARNGIGALTRCAGRTCGVSLLEAYDLMPVIECLKSDNMDTVQFCMDALEPWMQLSDAGGLSFSAAASNGFIGGSVGVIGTVVATQLKKGQVKDRLTCSYCAGSGQIMCGHCLGTKTISYLGPDGMVTEACPNCEGTGTVVCINCQGSGLSVPDDFLQVLGDEEVGFTEDDFIGLFDETPMAPAARTPTTAGASSKSAPAKETTASGSSPNDYTGGMG